MGMQNAELRIKNFLIQLTSAKTLIVFGTIL